MKKLAIGFVLVIATAAPAFAAGSTWDSWNRPAAHDSYSRNAYVAEPGYDAYAAAPMAGEFAAGPTMMGSPPVFAFGEYQGTDPDPFIRLQLKRDPATINNNGA